MEFKSKKKKKQGLKDERRRRIIYKFCLRRGSSFNGGVLRRGESHERRFGSVKLNSSPSRNRRCNYIFIHFLIYLITLSPPIKRTR